MKRLLLLLFTALVLSPDILMNRPTLQAAGPLPNQKANQKRFNLQGVWDEGGDEVKITQDGASVTASYSRESTCEYRGTVEPFHAGFQGTLTGNQLSGTAVSCYHGATAIGITRDDKIDLTVSEDGNTLTAIQRVRSREPFEFTLTRSCKEDKERLCGSVAAASKTLERMAGDNDVKAAGSSHAFFRDYISEQLDKLRAELCDDKDLQKQIDQAKSKITSLAYPRTQQDVIQRRNVATEVSLVLASIKQGSCSGMGSGACKEPELEKAQKERLEKEYQKLRDQLRVLWQRFRAHETLANSNISKYRQYIAVCAIYDIAIKLLEYVIGEGQSKDLVKLKDIIEKYSNGDILTIPLLYETSNEIELDDVFEAVYNGISALGAGNPQNVLVKINDCIGKVASDTLYRGAMAFIDNWEAALKLLPQIEQLMKKMEDVAEEHWSWQHKEYKACVEYQTCLGNDGASCPKPPAKPGISGATSNATSK